MILYYLWIYQELRGMNNKERKFNIHNVNDAGVFNP